VAKGTYIPSTIPRGWRAPASNIIPSGYFTFHLPKNIVLLGGYSSGGALRDPDLYPTTLGAIGKVTQIITVVKSDSIIIDGFTFRYGRAEKNTIIIDGVEYPRTVGGGLFISQSTIKVKNCRFYNNIAQLKGGAIYSENSLVKMDSCVFEKSRAYQLNTGIGGAVYFYAMQAGTYITKCRFKYNTAWLLGGAMAVENSPNPILIDSCYFNNNSLEQPVSSARGGALYAGLGGSMIIQRSVFDSNGAYRGGAIYLNEPGTVTISQSFFDRNSAINDGGAIAFFSFNKILNIANCLFYNNIGPAGGAINASGTVRVFFSSFYKNHATANGGAISNSGSVTSTGNIFWDNDLNGNTTVAGSDVTSVNGGGYSLFQKLSLPGSNHTTGVYPEFRDTSNVKGPDNAWGTADDGLQLKVNSPIINESTNNLTNLFGPNPIDYITDIKGSLRVEGRYPDLGPYETNFCELTNFTNRTAFVDSSATGGNQSGTSWQNAFTTIEEALKVARSHCVDTIKVAKGTYEATAAPGYNKYNTPPTGKSLVVPDSIYVMGGYGSGGAEHSIATNPTIVKGKNFDRAFWFNSVKNSTIDGFILDSAGLRADGSQLELRNSVIKQGNTEPTAPLFFGDSRARVINCAFANNHGNFISGTVWQENSFIDYINSVFANNSYADFGGASCIAIRGNGAANITNCTFYRNSVISGGTITRFDDAAQLNIKNSLFWNNRYQTFAPDPDINDIWIRTNNPVLFTTSNNLFMNGTAPSPADSSIYGINPGFADTTNLVGPDGQWLTPDDGLSLSDTSSAINEGSNSFVPSGITTDIAGLTRIANGIVDIGAYEFECTGARGYTNKLVQLGTQETSVNRLLGCGSLRYMESQTTPETYIAFIADNGNTINPSSVTVDATTNLVNFRTNGTDTTMLANRMLSIVAPGSYTTNGGVRVRIYYDPAEFSDLPHGLRSWFKHPAHTKAEVLNDLKFNGLTNATLLSPSSNGVENGIAYVEFSNVTSFSTFGFLGMTTIGPLPVNFLSFTAKEESLTGSAILDWATGWEKNNDRFEIERSSDGIQWKKIGSLNAKGSASQGAVYSFVDVSPDQPKSLYRIKQVDADEKFKYSAVREVIFHSNNKEFVISPNPAATIVNIRFPRIQSAINFEIIDISGRVKAKGIRINMQQFSLPVLELENGIYLLKINNSARKLIINR
jgi:predicted outer membrane repeat protein